MVSVVLSLLFITLLALAVLGVVAVPARRAGRRVLTAEGHEAVGTLRERATPGRPERDEPAPAAEDETRVPLSA
ncbi:hypothetical protein [Phycicoccus avicenniae]|uniref:hypothetical protein n=1 Tax=Phycicoccus avicenniae TaxID=2828860 RepID=UPI003D268343